MFLRSTVGFQNSVPVGFLGLSQDYSLLHTQIPLLNGQSFRDSLQAYCFIRGWTSVQTFVVVVNIRQKHG